MIFTSPEFVPRCREIADDDGNIVQDLATLMH